MNPYDPLMIVLQPLAGFIEYSLQPIAPFTWFGLGVNTLDVVATFRLCLFLRQLREILLKQHLNSKSAVAVEEKSFVHKVSTTLLLVFGGEVFIGPFLGVPPSFMTSGVYPGLYVVAQAVVEWLPFVPPPSPEIELPISIIDGIARSFLLCNIMPAIVTSSPNSTLASNPWTLLVTSLVIANGGFFFVNFFSFLSPTPLSVQTPPELQPYGWTTTDIWCAPLITGLYAFLTHPQPYWSGAYTLFLGEEAKAVNPATARALCALILSGLFAHRTAKNFGLLKPSIALDVKANHTSRKEKTQ